MNTLSEGDDRVITDGVTSTSTLFYIPRTSLSSLERAEGPGIAGWVAGGAPYQEQMGKDDGLTLDQSGPHLIK